MPAFSCDLEKTLSKAITIADETMHAHAERAFADVRPVDVTPAGIVAVANLCTRAPLYRIPEQQEV